ncbi:FecR family protein [Ohtaekwangia koreensis]|uniref:FecR family protein n=1 Tax=Ohtaekwangia koreensis TaxID=688867 RepID=A0A1T5M5Q3_9BACT|nr:FecR domain-containing protein [Ohtaekwangia koreensis]SKC83199.1 FecR family protein [Ohtaekwangia koreensis]
MTQVEFKALLDRYVKGECSIDEQKYFDVFFNAFQKDEKYWSDWQLTDKDRIQIEIYQSLTRTIDLDEAENEVLAPESRSFTFSFLKIAASVSILLLAGLFVYNFRTGKKETIKYITHTTNLGQRATITLDDGSVVKLNAGSTISFPEKFVGDTREITLYGEAFFEVKPDPDKPFIVTSGGLLTTVRGTSFNIRAYHHERIEITVSTGKVHVASIRKKEEAVLGANQQIQYDEALMDWKFRNVPAERYMAWTENIIYLDRTSVQELVNTLERWYNVKIELENGALQNCTISGKYKSDRLTNILEGLKIMHGITYRFASEREIIISGKPCNP